MTLLNPFPDKEIWVYDLEVYPNFFMALFSNGERKLELFSGAEISDFVCDPNKILVGYNILNYDNIILAAILENKVRSISDVYRLSRWIIEHDRDDMNERANFNKLKYAHLPWHKSADLSIFFLDDESGRAKASLKDIAIRLGFPKIQDLPYDFDKPITPEQIREVRRYCANDIGITEQLWNKMADLFLLRQELECQYGVDCFGYSNAQISENILLSEYCRATGKTKAQIKQLSTDRDEIKIAELIPDVIEFTTPENQELLRYLKSRVLRKVNGKWDTLEIEVLSGDLVLELKKGGIHSKDSANVFIPTENQRMIDIDVTSFYPNIITNFGVKPAHLTSKWTEIVRELTAKRVDAKRSGNKTFADALKIVINSAFGKAGNQYSFMHDPALLLSITITGQLLIIMLLEQLTLPGIEPISANTDGVTVLVDDAKYEDFRKVCKEWQTQTRFELEEAEYSVYARRNVNNYLAVLENGKTKQKGEFNTGMSLSRKNDGQVIAQALTEYFRSGTPIEHTIYQETDIRKFCYSYKATRNFAVFFGGQKAQKTNRFYISVPGRRLEKKRLAGKGKVGEISLVTNGESVSLCNDLPDVIPGDIDYSFYIQKAKEILNFTLAEGKAQEIRELGIIPVPKQYKKNPQKSKLNEVQEWCFGDYHGIGAYTGEFVNTIAIDIDNPKALKISRLFEPTLTVWHGSEGGYENVASGKKRGTLVYFLQDNALKSTAKAFLDKHGFEILYGGKPVQLFGMHTSLENYQYEGKVAQIPEKLHDWIVQNTKKNARKRKQEIDLTTGDLFFEVSEEETFSEDIQNNPDLEKKFGALLKEFGLSDLMPYNKQKFAHHKRGRCPFEDSHSSKSANTNFDIGITEENQIHLGCFHVNCESERKQLREKMNARWQEITAPEKLNKLAKILEERKLNTIADIMRSKHKFILLEAPTGSGKSHESALFFLECISKEIPVVFAGSNKVEIEQFWDYVCEIAKVEDVRKVNTQVIMRDEISKSDDTEIDISIADNTLGIITHHGYLLRKGLSDRFYSLHVWCEKKKPVGLIDEADHMIEKATWNIPMRARYTFRKSKGEAFGRYVRRNSCPLANKSGNCSNCTMSRAQTYEANDYHTFQIFDQNKISENDFGSEASSFDWPEFITKNEVVLKDRIVAKSIEKHDSYVRQKSYKYIISEDEEISAQDSIMDLVECMDFPTIYQEFAVFGDTKERINEPGNVVDENNKHRVIPPNGVCEVPVLSGRDMGGFELLRRNFSKVVYLSARFSETKKSFLKKVHGDDLKEFKVTESKQKIDQLMIVNYSEKLQLIERQSKHKKMFYHEINQILVDGKPAKTLAFLPKKSDAEDVFRNIPKDEPTGFYKEDRVNVDEKFVEGQYSALISYSRGPIGRAINLGQYYLATIDTKIYKPAVAYNLQDLTVEEIETQMEDDRLDNVYQNAGRIIRGHGRKALLLYNSDAQLADWLAKELKIMVNQEIVRTDFHNDQCYPKQCVVKWLMKNEVCKTDLTIIEERKISTVGVSISSTLSKKQRKEYSGQKESILDVLMGNLRGFSGTWREFRIKNNIPRKLKSGKITKEEEKNLKVMFDSTYDNIDGA